MQILLNMQSFSDQRFGNGQEIAMELALEGPLLSLMSAVFDLISRDRKAAGHRPLSLSAVWSLLALALQKKQANEDRPFLPPGHGALLMRR